MEQTHVPLPLSETRQFYISHIEKRMLKKIKKGKNFASIDSFPIPPLLFHALFSGKTITLDTAEKIEQFFGHRISIRLDPNDNYSNVLTVVPLVFIELDKEHLRVDFNIEALTYSGYPVIT